MPHLDAAYNLARWLSGNEVDAHDVVQEAYLRAWKFFGTFRGGDASAWLLSIVRNTCFTWMEKNRRGISTGLDEEAQGLASPSAGPEEAMQRSDEGQMLRRALEELSIELREVVVLRELEGLSYKEIASALGLPMGTVMSRLSRGRDRLQQCLVGRAEQESELGL